MDILTSKSLLYLFSGNTTVTVSGKSLDAVSDPQLTFTLEIMRERVVHENKTLQEKKERRFIGVCNINLNHLQITFM